MAMTGMDLPVKKQDIAAQTLEQATHAGADAADVLFYDSVELSAACRMGRQETLERSESSAIGLRVWVGQRQAIASASDLSHESIAGMAERAVAMAKVATDDPYSMLAQPDLQASDWPDLDLADAAKPKARTLYEQALAAEAAALEVPGITNSEGGAAGYGRSRMTLATSAGFFGSYESTNASISASVIAGQADSMETDYDYAVTRYFVDLPDPCAIGRKAAERTLKRLNPRKAESSQVPVIFDPRVGRGLVSTFAGAISGASVARGTTFLKERLGEAIFSDTVSIVDDPLRLRGLASHPFDGEGVRVQKLNLVENGVLQSWLLDVRTANQLGLKTTGHASRGLASPPSPSSTNLYMEAGRLSPQELMADITSGLYITETQGMGVNTVTGDYSQGAAGFWIENGEITHPVAEVTIAGHMNEMFAAITPANDLEFRYGTNAPTFRIEQMTVAGS